ncbi:hypothetical protein BT93_J1856 [Corymbia citriodora subsp. variegata]|nr:hypothetical protein BT93_J1856 [Corymbia citriodora subsp. variegata]
MSCSRYWLGPYQARRLSKVLSPWSEVWKEWELRCAVFFSLALQIFLICLGNRRKYVHCSWIRVVTWLAYMLADSVAIYALGMISNMIGDIMAGESVNKMDPHAELSTFWAPFLLLHLGGPDTISAYSMEDNELWLRHSLTLVNQTGLTVYVLVMAWTHPILSFLAILILLSGFYKYSERVWVLRAASYEHFRDSLAESQPRRKYSNKILEEYELKGAEGYSVAPHQVIEVRDDAVIMINDAIVDQEYKGDVRALLAARSLVNTSQRLFADHSFSLEERDTCLSILHTCLSKLHKVIEIELSLIYDVFYAKAKAVYTSWGFICRLAISFSICVSLVVFCLLDRRRYSETDQCLTFLLLGAAIFLELYALSHIFFSDRFTCWLIKNKQSAVFNIVNRIQPLSKRRRWSNSIGLYSLMRCSFKENDSCWWRFLKLLHVDEMGLKFLYQGREEVTEDVRKAIHKKIKNTGKKVKEEQKLPSSWIDRGGHVLSTQLLDQLKWSIELDFDMSILVWHIATELCYYPDSRSDSIRETDRNNQTNVMRYSLMSLHLSRYMLHLLAMYPSMLPIGIGSIRFRDIYKETEKYFAPASPAHGHNKSERMRTYWQTEPGTRREHDPEIKEACDVLRGQVKTEFNLSVTKEDKIKYVLFNGCRLASELERIPSEPKKWEVIRDVWVEMLIYAAGKCKARDHAQQMRRGGEFITHVWFLMAHFGLTDNFQIPHAPAIAEIMVNSC